MIGGEVFPTEYMTLDQWSAMHTIFDDWAVFKYVDHGFVIGTTEYQYRMNQVMIPTKNISSVRMGVDALPEDEVLKKYGSGIPGIHTSPEG
jgi:hypothetical protein